MSSFARTRTLTLLSGLALTLGACSNQSSAVVARPATSRVAAVHVLSSSGARVSTRAATAWHASGSVPAGSVSPEVYANRLARFMTTASVTCPNPDECNEAVAMLVISRDTDGATCTGFLVGPDTMATASHCIPKNLKPAASDCGQQIKVMFPALGDRPAENFDCAQVLSATDISHSDPADPKADYAIIRLQGSVDRKPLTVSRDGFVPNLVTTIVKVNPLSKTDAIGEMHSVTCNSVQGSAWLPHSIDNNSPTVGLEGCATIPGNSGSPVIDSNGLVHGVFQDFILSGAAVPGATESDIEARLQNETNLRAVAANLSHAKLD